MSSFDQPPTACQLETVRIVHEHIQATGICPTFRQVASACGICVRAAWCRLHACRNKALVSFLDGEPGTLTVTAWGLYCIGEPVCSELRAA